MCFQSQLFGSRLSLLPNAPENNPTEFFFSTVFWKWPNYCQEEECEEFPGAVCDVRAHRRPLRIRQPGYSRAEHSQPKLPTAGDERCLAPTPKQTPKKTPHGPPPHHVRLFFLLPTFEPSVFTELRIASYYTNNAESNAENGCNINCAGFTVFIRLSFWNWDFFCAVSDPWPRNHLERKNETREIQEKVSFTSLTHKICHPPDFYFHFRSKCVPSQTQNMTEWIYPGVN